jgi:hypothetical protein
MSRKPATLGTSRKVIGSLAVVGTAAAVAGLGTFGTFSDSTAPVSTTVSTGTVDINLAQPGGAVAIPANVSGFVPGDSMSRAVNLSNNGTSALSSISLGSSSTASNLLVTDTTNGLQLSVKACSVAYTGVATTAPTCSGTERTLYSGAAVTTNSALTGLNSMNAGGTDYLVFTVSLPTSAGNTFQGLSAPLSITFTGVQRNAAAQ